MRPEQPAEHYVLIAHVCRVRHTTLRGQLRLQDSNTTDALHVHTPAVAHSQLQLYVLVVNQTVRIASDSPFHFIIIMLSCVDA